MTGLVGCAQVEAVKKFLLFLHGGLTPIRKELKPVIPINNVLELMIAFATLVLLIVNSHEKK